MTKTYLIITPFFPTHASFRGSYIYDQAKAIIENGSYNVVLLRPTPFYSRKKDYTFEGIKIHYFETFDLPSAIFPGLFNRFNFMSFKETLNSLNISIENIDIVHSHVTALGVYAIYLKKKASNIRTILQHHGFDVLSLSNGVLSRFNWHRNWVKSYGVKICNQIDLHIGVSSKTLDYVRAVPEIKMKTQYVLYNGVDLNKFYAIKNQKDLSIFTIGCIANFWTLKDQITLIKALELLLKIGYKNVKILFIGTGQTLENCKEYVIQNKLSDYVEFLSEINHRELNLFYNKLNLFVLPSFFEAYGCVYTEAYACGVPFIGVKGQGIEELIPETEKASWLIEKSDHTKLYKLITIFINNPKKQNLKINLDINDLIKNYLSFIKNK
jgi:glycosyltransferase involved in cell wall biosynthesis